MTEQDLQHLREWGEELAAAQNSPWEPACVARAFARPKAGAVVFTMQHWIDLEEMRSPLLLGHVPEDLADLEKAANLFQLSVRGMDGLEAARVAIRLRDLIMDGFAMALPMRQEGVSAKADRDGFGSWGPLFTFLLTECGDTHAVASARPVSQAFVLLATRRRNQGWEVAGTSYAERDAIGKEHAHV